MNGQVELSLPAGGVLRLPAQVLLAAFPDELIDALVERIEQRRKPERRWLTVREAAVYMGLSVSTVEKGVAAHRIPHVHHGRRVLLHPDQLDRYMQGEPA